MTYQVGDFFPVWWNTGAAMVNGFYPARILEVLPYRGRFAFSAVLRVAAPETKRGWMEIAAG